MAEKELSPRQKLLVEKLDSADREIDLILRPSSLGRRFARPIHSLLAQDVVNFLKAGREAQWIIMAGLRGVGKTTLLAQLYLNQELADATKFYMSLDQAQLAGAEMSDVIVALEAKLGCPLAEAKQPIFVFLDEVHSLPNWSLAAKILYDRCPKLFLICTSSSALALWTNKDIARRARFVRVGPLSLPEAAFINASNDYDDYPWDDSNPNELRPNTELGGKIKSALFDSDSVVQAYSQLRYLEDEIGHYWRNLNSKNSIEGYVASYETLPYALAIKYRRDSEGQRIPSEHSKREIRIRIRQTLEKVYNHDLPAIGQFDQSTRRHFPGLLLWLANSNQQSLNKMSGRLGFNVRTLQNMFEVLVNSEVLTAIPPFGSSSGKIAKPYKYLFTAPAVRQALNNSATGQPIDKTQLDQLRGNLLEDAVGLYLKQAFSDQPLGGLVEYDSSQSGADFVVMPTHIKTESIALEVGWQKKTGRQVEATLERTKSNRYGLVVTDCSLKLDEAKRTLFVPLKTFFLMQPEGLPKNQDLNLRKHASPNKISIEDVPF